MVTGEGFLNFDSEAGVNFSVREDDDVTPRKVRLTKNGSQTGANGNGILKKFVFRGAIIISTWNLRGFVFEAFTMWQLFPKF